MLLGALACLSWLPAAAAPAEPAAPTQLGSGPVPLLTAPPPGLRGHALWDSYFDLAPFGYEEQELFVSGTAVDAAGTPAPYTTRIIVTRPSSPADFNGTVLLDWVNVTAQFENAVDTMLAREMLLREGFAYVHVSAQAAGLCCLPALTPQTWDPVRYASLDHPGDAWAFDLFTQVARAFEAPGPAGSVDPMGSLGLGRVERILAAGQSQSANRLSDYVSEWLPAHPAAVGAIDGVLVHGNVPGDKAFAVGAPVPVLHLLSDFEAVADGVDPATVDPNYRLWEVAGAAHADHWIGYQSIFGHGPRVAAGLPKQTPDQFRAVLDGAGNYGEVLSPLLAVCVAAGAAMPMHYATSTALHELDGWVAGEGAPDNGPRFAFAGGVLATDQYGNTLGGIRLPPIDVPVARYQSTTCQLGGVTIPFTDLELLALYGSHASYVASMATYTDRAVADGWLLPEDAVDLMRRACRASIRFLLAAPSCPAYVPPTFDQPLAAAPPSG
ncbi:MAG: hypothetical protein H0W25_15485, partial [Acidimicrobiia bacterium]|nr:hypothetical protein [Acidimicrobiia bacterium]